MSKIKTQFKCSSCGAVSARWSGQCSACQEWGTVVEVQGVTTTKQVGVKSTTASSAPEEPARRVRDVDTHKYTYESTGMPELDRVLGGGIVPGAAILLVGEPGAGKSTLALQAANAIANTGKTVLVVSGEESAQQVRMRALRIKADADDLFIASETDIAKVMGQIDLVQPDFMVIDSVQAIASGDIASSAGSTSQVIEVTTLLCRIAKERGIPMILIGQITKSGDLAGPMRLAHIVDVVLFFAGEEDSAFRILRGQKNRFGPADEIGCFEHSEEGLVEVPDPSGVLLGRREEPVSGVATTFILEGKRPLPLEVQALVSPTSLPVPRRASSGLDNARVTMVQAVVEKHGRVRIHDKDVFASTSGGLKAKEPAADLALAVAIAASAKNFALPNDVVILGETTLSGEVRRVPGIERRLNEAQRLGFKVAIIPDTGAPIKTRGIRTYVVRTVMEAFETAARLSGVYDND